MLASKIVAMVAAGFGDIAFFASIERRIRLEILPEYIGARIVRNVRAMVGGL